MMADRPDITSSASIPSQPAEVDCSTLSSIISLGQCMVYLGLSGVTEYHSILDMIFFQPMTVRVPHLLLSH